MTRIKEIEEEREKKVVEEMFLPHCLAHLTSTLQHDQQTISHQAKHRISSDHIGAEYGIFFSQYLNSIIEPKILYDPETR